MGEPRKKNQKGYKEVKPFFGSKQYGEAARKRQSQLEAADPAYTNTKKKSNSKKS